MSVAVLWGFLIKNYPFSELKFILLLSIALETTGELNSG